MAVPEDVTIPATLDVMVMGNGGFTVASGRTLTINGSFDAPAEQVFFGSGSVVFNKVYDLYPEWWGIDGVADEVEINKAIQASPEGATVWLGASYSTTASIALNKTKRSLKGRFPHASYITTAADINCIVVSARYCQVANIFLWSTCAAPTTSTGVLVSDAMDGRYDDVYVVNFAYGYYLCSATSAGVAFNEFRGCSGYEATESLILINGIGAGSWVNENHFWGGSWTASDTGRHVEILLTDSNQNVFNAMCFQGGDPDKFGLVDHGTNTFCNNRLEIDSHGLYVHNTSNSQRIITKFYSNLYSLTGLGKVPMTVVDGRAVTDTWFAIASCSGSVIEGDVLSTTVDITSNSGQKVLSIASTTGLYLGSPIVIDEGGANEEWNVVAAITPGVSITLDGNLKYTHTSGDAHVVSSHGKFYGQVSFPSESEEFTHYFAKGEKIFILDASVDSALGYKGIGVRSESGGLITRSYENTVTLSGAYTDFGANHPAGTKLLGVQFRVDTAITSGDGATSWAAAYNGGSTTALVTGQAFTKNTRASALIVPEIATNITAVRITPNSGTFSGGVMSVICYYEDTVVMNAAP
jgi:hypothetical protein